MSLDNMTPDEVRLLDEFAGRWFCEHRGEHDLQPSEWASDAYLFAAAMIAERRKRVPSLPVQDLNCADCGEKLLPDQFAARRPTLGGVVHFDCERANAGRKQGAMPTPPAEQPADGNLLTEEAVADWIKLAESAPRGGFYQLDPTETCRAEALMREGLAAKQYLANARALHQDDHWCIDQQRRRAEKAEAALAEAQPVLDAVVKSDLFNSSGVIWYGEATKTIQAYADRRREQAKNAGGAK